MAPNPSPQPQHLHNMLDEISYNTQNPRPIMGVVSLGLCGGGPFVLWSFLPFLDAAQVLTVLRSTGLGASGITERRFAVFVVSA